jgi:hypothetical protein
MKLKLKFLRHHESADARRMIQSDLEVLAKEVDISQATAVVAGKDEGDGRLTTRVHLEVPGPDIRAEAKGYTIREAWSNLYRIVLRRLEHRQRKLISKKLPSKTRRPGFVVAARG